MPAPQLMSLLFSIEQAVVAIARKRPRLVDKDAEAVFITYRKFFQDIRQGKDADDPYSTLRHKQELLDEIWEVLVYREQQGADAEHLDGSFASGNLPVTTVEELYILAFNELRKSARLWRKKNGPKGYLKHIEEHLRDSLGSDHQFFHGKVSDESDEDRAQSQLNLDWLEKEHGIKLTTEPNRVLPEDVTEEQFVYQRSFSRNPAAHVDRLREIVADYPEHPQLTNDLIRALITAGQEPEANAIAEKMVADHPDYLLGVCNYLRFCEDEDRLQALSPLLGPEREITHFTAGKNGAYHLTEYLLFEQTAIKLFCTDHDYEAAMRRLERVLELGIPGGGMLDSAESIVLLDFQNQEEQRAAKGEEFSINPPPNVTGCERAVPFIKQVQGLILRREMGDRSDMN